jgi:hypothetical protein
MCPKTTFGVLVDITNPKGNTEIINIVREKSANKVQETIISLLFLCLRF